MIDVSQQINSVRREVGTRMLEAGEARTVTISQSYRAPIDDEWDARTTPNGFRAGGWHPRTASISWWRAASAGGRRTSPPERM